MPADKHAAEADCEAFCTSGPSPTTLHLVGPGQVGREVLDLLAELPLRLTGISDSTATLHSRDGLDASELAAFKARGGRLAAREGAEPLKLELALDLVDADLVVDCTPTRVDAAQLAAERARGVLRRGKRLALAAKDAVCHAGPELLELAQVTRLGINAVLGGTGLALCRQHAELRRDCAELALCGNATTTGLVAWLEAGGKLEDGIAEAQARGVLEPDPSLDLSGKDAATKLCAVAGLIFGTAPDISQVTLPEDFRRLDPELLRQRRTEGRTTRLIGRASRSGALRLEFEELAIGDPLACPDDRVAYSYTLSGGTQRVHTGAGIGPRGTAEAVIEDLRAFIQPGEGQR